MKIDFEPYFERYRQLAKAADQVFDRVRDQYSDRVKCKVSCMDCCYAIFDVPLIEALYLNHTFNDLFKADEKENLIEKANRIDRTLHKLKRNAYKAFSGGKDENDILLEMGREKVRCPLLNENNQCAMYEARPITCRLYGIPIAIGGTGRTCGLSGFAQGEAYPTVNLDILHRKLFELSEELVVAMESRHTKMAEILMPVSMAILTDFDDEFLGISEIPQTGILKDEDHE